MAYPGASAWLPPYRPMPVPPAASASLPTPFKICRRAPASGFAEDRRLPQWAARAFEPATPAFGPEGGPEVVLWADTFNRYFEPENWRQPSM